MQQPPVRVVVQLPAELVADLEPLLQSRGLSVDEVCRLYLRSLVTTSQKSRALELTSVMPFGKYKGERLEVIIRAAPEYIRWLIGEKDLKISPEALQLLEEIVGE
jgi:uncharacterized protein (DUF3820 family)